MVLIFIYMKAFLDYNFTFIWQTFNEYLVLCCIEDDEYGSAFRLLTE